MINFIKTNRKWACLFCIWMAGGVLALSLVVLKTHDPWFSRQKKDVDNRYGIKMLNFYLPNSYQDLIASLDQNQSIPGNYVQYYQVAVEFLPEDFAGHYLLGLCRQSRGEWEQAAALYRRAIDLNPYFFWSYYNLGLLYWKVGKSQEAMGMFALGLNTQPQFTLKSMTSTKLLLDCLGDRSSAGYDMVQSLKQGYQQVSRWVKGEESPEGHHPVLF